MTTIKSSYTGDLRTQSTHLKSGSELITDAPTDNKGKGEAFSPTDLVATSLGTCMLTIMGIAAREGGYSIDGTEIEITKKMAAGPRRVAEIHVVFHMPDVNYTEEQREQLYRAAVECPVTYSLHPDIVQGVEFRWVESQPA